VSERDERVRDGGGSSGAAFSGETDRSRRRGRFLGERKEGARPPWRRALRIGAVVLVVLLIAAGVAARWGVPYYAITPGNALNVANLISVPKSATHTHPGRVILTDVELTQLSALAYAYYYVTNRSDIVSSADVTGGASSSQYEEQGVIDMVLARQAAAFVALRTLGYRPLAVPVGVVVYAIEPDTPFSSAPSVGDVLTAIDGKKVAQISDVVADLNVRTPESTVTLTYHALGRSRPSTRTFTVDEFYKKGSGAGLEISCRPANTRSAGTPALSHGRVIGCLPFGGYTIFHNEGEPFPVSIQSNGIIGPSAGLSFTLGVIEKLDKKDLTGGHRVAATGTMSNDGSVGAVGGVAQKTIAVREAGASVFLVPPSGLAAAKANAGPYLKVVAVSAIRQAIVALERLGGQLAAATSHP